MRTWLRHNPHRFWQVGLALLPLWLAVGVWGWLLVEQLPLPGPIEPASGVQAAMAGEGLVEVGSLDSYRSVWHRPLRQRLIEPEAPPEPEPQPQERAVRFTLLGTVVEGDRSYAIVRDDQGQIVLAKLGMTLDSFVVQAIEADRVGLRRDGTTRYLKLPDELRRLVPVSARTHRAAHDGTRAEPPPLEQAIPGAQEDEKAVALNVRLSGLSSERFMNETRLMPAINARGIQVGFRLDSIARESAVQAMGLRSGDVIVAIDDAPLNQLTDMDRIYHSLDQGKHHEWRVLRDEQLVRVEVIPFESTKESHDERN